MFDLIVVAGDSNSFGSETIKEGDNMNPESINCCYGKYLQEMLNITCYVNVAYPGLSNIKIFNKVVQVLNNLSVNPADVLIIIGWSETNRIPIKIGSTEYNMSESIVSSIATDNWLNPAHKTLYKSIEHAPFLKDFLRGIASYIFSSESFAYQDMLLKLAMDGILKNKGVKYFTFPTFEEGHFPQYNHIRGLFSNNHLFTYNDDHITSLKSFTKFNMFEMFEQYGRSKINFHLKKEAHEKLAEFLIEEMTKRKIINTV